MKIGLVGLPQTGRTTIFRLLTHAGGDAYAASTVKMGADIGVARIPDKRIDFLKTIYKPKKTTYATIEVIDIQGVAMGSGEGGSAAASQFLEALRQVDALVHVIRTFHNKEVAHISGELNPLKDIDAINMELLFADLSIIENRINRIESGRKATKELQQELEVMKKCREGLENERLIHTLDLTDEEKQFLKTFNFLTERPMILLVNMDDDQYRTGKYEQKAEIAAYASERHLPVVEICAETELEINQLEEEDRKLFMEDLGIKETGINLLAAAAYDYLGLISFLTVGDDEVRAWPIKKGISAKSAAGKVHSDIERGFIRAEVVKYADFEHLGSMQKTKEKGLFRLEGKEYIVVDGDIINFRFNV